MNRRLEWSAGRWTPAGIRSSPTTLVWVSSGQTLLSTAPESRQPAGLRRQAVLKAYRGRGLGASVVLALIREAENRGMNRVYLGAQRHATGFYEKLGFAAYGEPYMEVNIEHVHMERFM